MRENIHDVIAAWREGSALAQRTFSTDGISIKSFDATILTVTGNGWTIFNTHTYSKITTRRQQALLDAIAIDLKVDVPSTHASIEDLVNAAIKLRDAGDTEEEALPERDC